jgi:hypothetical protein
MKPTSLFLGAARPVGGNTEGEFFELTAHHLVTHGVVVGTTGSGFLPPHPANPPTKRPLVSLMKQARAFGVGVVVATQNPMDLDYRALSNAGLWCLGRLQTDADRERVLDGIAATGAGFDFKRSDLDNIVKRLSPRWFLMRDSHSELGLQFLQPRWTMTYMRGPMTRNEIRQARAEQAADAPDCAAQ